ncbi:MAG: hypothetical protein AAF141_03455 [Pseudomonadota bacterium]
MSDDGTRKSRLFRAELGSISCDDIEQIVVIGSWPNSSFSYYLEPQFEHLPAASIRLLNRYLAPHTVPDDAPSCYQRNPETGALNTRTIVVINRYVKGSMLRWVENNRRHIAALVYFTDDDMAAMARDKSVPLIKKQQPLKTIAHWRKLMSTVDCVVASTKELAGRIEHPNKIILPPVLHPMPAQNGRSDPNHVAYLAKMHKAEHAFLQPIIEKCMAEHDQMRFSVIAEGQSERAWRRIARRIGPDRLHVVGPQTLNGYFRFLQSLDAGISLAPLEDTPLNRARSATKRYDAVRLGAAGLFADLTPYTGYGHQTGEIYLPARPDDWQEAISVLMSDRKQWEFTRNASRVLALTTLAGLPKLFPNQSA